MPSPRQELLQGRRELQAGFEQRLQLFDREQRVIGTAATVSEYIDLVHNTDPTRQNIIKRAHHIFSPFHRHPLFFLIDVPNVIGSKKKKRKGTIAGTRERKSLEAQEKRFGNGKAHMVEIAEMGHQVFSQLLATSSLHTQANSVYEGGVEAVFNDVPLYSSMYTALREQAGDPALRYALSILRVTIDNLPTVATEADKDNIFTDDQQRMRVMFATAVGLTQTVAEQRLEYSLELSKHQTRKRGVRDHVLMFAMHRLTQSGKQDIADHLIAVNVH